MLRSMIKGAVAFFVIGVIVGLVMPTVAGWLGAASLVTAGSAAWQLPVFEGALFGMFGFFAPALQRLCNRVFGDPEGKAAAAHTQESEVLKARVVELEGREQMVEQVLTGQSRAASAIVAQGPRNGASFEAAEQARASHIDTGLLR